MVYKCSECEEPHGIPVFAETESSYARVSEFSLSQNPPAYNHQGHVLVLPKRHVADRRQLTSPKLLDLNDLANDVADVVKQVFGYKSIIIMEIDGERGERHLHKHIIPADFPYAVKMTPKKLSERQVLDLTKLLKQAF